MAIRFRRDQRTRPIPGRHLDDGRGLHAFGGQVAVCCARCGRAGWVVAQPTSHRWSVRFRCSHCSFAADSGEGVWLGPVSYRGRRPCGYCGHQWVSACLHREAAAQVQVTTVVACPQCGHENVVGLECHRERGNAPRDPHFGMPLALVTTTRAGELWAYNDAHLQQLLEFSRARLRESCYVGNASMMSRLPTWMKLARNRKLVETAVMRLQAQLATLPAVPPLATSPSPASS